MNPFDALAVFALGKLKQNAMAKWMRLCFELAMSATISFLVIGGSVMVATHSAVIGAGSGMVMAGVALAAKFRQSDLCKGMAIVLPAAEAAKEMQTDLETIEKK